MRSNLTPKSTELVMHWHLRVLLLFWVTSASLVSLAQVNQTSFVEQARKTIEMEYSRQLDQLPILNNGKEYKVVLGTNGQHPFYDTHEMQTGTIVYAGEKFESVPLQYDIWHDCIVTLHQAGKFKIELVNELVDYFEINGSRFVFLTTRQGVAKNGFYEMAYSGKPTSVLIRYSKSLQRTSQGKNVEFRLSTSYYLKSGYKVTEVKSKKSVLACLKDQEGSLKQFIRSNQISFSGDRRGALSRVVSYYDLLMNEVR